MRAVENYYRRPKNKFESLRYMMIIYTRYVRIYGLTAEEVTRIAHRSLYYIIIDIVLFFMHYCITIKRRPQYDVTIIIVCIVVVCYDYSIVITTSYQSIFLSLSTPRLRQSFAEFASCVPVLRDF